MATLTVRGLSDEVVDVIKKWAQTNHQSVNGWMKTHLETITAENLQTSRWHKQFVESRAKAEKLKAQQGRQSVEVDEIVADLRSTREEMASRPDGWGL